LFTNTKIATTTLVALSLSLGLSACSPAQNDATPPTTSASATASPTASEGAVPAESAVSVPSETASATADSSDASDPAQTAEAANGRINDFMDAIKVDALVLTADPKFASAPVTQEVFDEAFANSISFIDKSKFSNDKIQEIVGGFASIYMADPDATIASKSSESMKTSGDTATIEGNAFTVTMNGTEKKGSSGSGGSMTLTFADGEWKITDYVDGPSSK
jgi:hypothetical protein